MENKYFILVIVIFSISINIVAQPIEISSDFNGDGYDDLAIGITGLKVQQASNAGGIGIIYGSSSGLNFDHKEIIVRSNGLPGQARANEQLGASMAVGDFNGDAFADLAVGSPLASTVDGATLGAGNVEILYGSRTGLKSALSLDPNAERVAFSLAMTAGDFNNDGFDELVIGVPHNRNFSGAILVYPGREDGLETSLPTLISSQGLGFSFLTQERFGGSLETGDFNNDGFFDLAIGASGMGIAGVTNPGINSNGYSGSVIVLYGTSRGLELENKNAIQFYDQNSDFMPDTSETSDFFGAALAAGNFDGKGSMDLAIGVPRESFEENPGIFNAGRIQLLFGFEGLSTNENRTFHQESTGISGTREQNDFMGTSMLGADIDGDGVDELFVGVPYEDFAGFDDAGVVQMVDIANSSTNAFDEDLINQDSEAMGLGIEKDDYFGLSLGRGDFNGDGFQDVVIGSPGEDLDGKNEVGSLLILFGSTAGLSFDTKQYVTSRVFSTSMAQNGLKFGSAVSKSMPMKKNRKPLVEKDTFKNDNGTIKTNGF